MHRAPIIQVKEMVLASRLVTSMQNVAGQLAPTSHKTYTVDAKHSIWWMADQNLSLSSLGRDDLVAYRAHLVGMYAKQTASRMWAVESRLLDEAIQRDLLVKNSARAIRSFKAGDDESSYRELKREEANELLEGNLGSLQSGVDLPLSRQKGPLHLEVKKHER